MPRARARNLATADRERLLAIAARHFARGGLEDASLNEILAEAGLSKGVYYYYFDDKDDLFATVLESAIDGMLARVPLPATETLTRRSFWPTVERLARSWSTSFSASRDLVKAAAQLTEERRRNPRFAPLLARMHGLYRALVEAGQRLGRIRRDLPVDVLVRLLEANDAVLDAVLLSRGGALTSARLEEHMGVVLDTFRRLLEVREARPRPPTRRARA